MQQVNVIEMKPGSYRYANRRQEPPLQQDFVKLVMEQQFSTVLGMHNHQVARIVRLQQTADEFLTEYKKKHILRKMRRTIDKQKAKNRKGTQALGWNVNTSSCSLLSSSEHAEPTDLKHAETCAFEICDRRREECISNHFDGSRTRSKL